MGPARTDDQPASRGFGLRIEEFRASFPIASQRTYLATGAIAPAASPVTSAVTKWMYLSAARPLRNFDDWGSSLEELRLRFASLIGADPAGVAITDNTSRAAGMAIGILGRRPGSNVIVDATTYPSSLFPWISRTAKRVVTSRRELDDATVARLAGRDLAAVAVSHVAWQTGYRHHLRALADAAHALGGVLMVDCAQSTGAVPVDVKADGIDVLVTTAMKWLCGLPGVGFLYVDPRLLDDAPAGDGSLGVSWPGGWDAWPAAAPPRYPDTARRFEPGVPALPSVAAASAALDLVASVSVDRLAAHIQSLVTMCLSGLQRLGCDVATPADPNHRAGVIAVRHPRAGDLGDWLAERRIDVWRSREMQLLRVDPAGFTTAAEVARLLDEIAEWKALMNRPERQ
jgi:cysteine desulfurase / selenocysteine lyase